MKAFLLAGGYGTRLKPITDQIPKCLVEIAGRPLLDYWLEQLVANGCKDILINTHYLHEQVERYLQCSQYSEYVSTVHEPELLGTLGSVKANRDFLDSDANLIAHADNFCLTNWQRFFQAFRHRPVFCNLTMMLFETTTPWSCGLVKIDNEDVLTEYIEKPEAAKTKPHLYGNLANAAVFVASPKAVDEICAMPDTCEDLCRDYLPLQVHKANTYVNKGVHIDIGTPETYALANEVIQNKKGMQYVAG